MVREYFPWSGFKERSLTKTHKFGEERYKYERSYKYKKDARSDVDFNKSRLNKKLLLKSGKSTSKVIGEPREGTEVWRVYSSLKNKSGTKRKMSKKQSYDMDTIGSVYTWSGKRFYMHHSEYDSRDNAVKRAKKLKKKYDVNYRVVRARSKSGNVFRIFTTKDLNKYR